MPGIALLEWHEAAPKIDWGSVLIFGSSIGLALALQQTGTVDWLAGVAFGVTNKLPVHFMATAIYLCFMIIRFGFGSVLGFVTVVIPVAIATATTNNLSPVWLAMVALGWQQSLLFPSFSVTDQFAGLRNRIRYD